MATSTQRSGGLATESLGGLHWVGIVLAAVSGAIHLFLGVDGVTGSQYFSFELGVAFLLAGLGFLGAVALVLLDIRRRAVYAVGIPFTAVQIVIWYYSNFATTDSSFPGDVGTFGAIDKIAQVLLIVVLIALLRGE